MSLTLSREPKKLLRFPGLLCKEADLWREVVGVVSVATGTNCGADV